MTHPDWNKAMDAVMSHEWIALAVLVWLLCIAGYLTLQVWFGCAWTDRWRIAALVPLVGLAAVVVLAFIGQSYDPDVFGPVASPFDNLIVSVLLLSPLGFIYLVIAGIVRRARRKLNFARPSEMEATTAATKPRIVQTAVTAWGDTFRMIGAMPLIFGIALAIDFALSLATLAVVPDPLAFAASGPLHAALLVVVSAVLSAILFAPLAIVAHRFVLLGETTNRYPLDPFRARYVRFAGFAILFKLALVLPNTLMGLQSQMPANPLATAAFSLATIALTAVIFIVAVRRIILFPAIAIDAPGATWSNARRDTKGSSWRVLFIFVCTALPQLIFGALIGLVVLRPEFKSGGWLAIYFVGPLIGIPTICAFAAAASHIFRARADSLTRASS
ncbi:MAG: hypothetical protein ACLPX7_16260 [Xanthobacteraceae bacterium]